MVNRNQSTPKRARDVIVRSDLLAEAKRRQWLEQNRQSIDAYNEYCEKQGVFSDELRGF
jgi:post-segregation antitoxin (ccd killing protein)